MDVRSALAVGGIAVVGLLASAGPALAVCDAYSGTCTEPPAVLSTEPPAVLSTEAPAVVPDGEEAEVLSRTQSQPETVVRGAVVPSNQTPTTLPFTGGELILVSALGAAAVAGGTFLVIAGRRRQGSAAV